MVEQGFGGARLWWSQAVVKPGCGGARAVVKPGYGGARAVVKPVCGGARLWWS